MNYSNDETMVRVDFWKPSGKWYATEALKWDRFQTENKDGVELIHDTFKRIVREQLKGHYQGMTATCLQPCHEHSHPLMIIVSEE